MCRLTGGRVHLLSLVSVSQPRGSLHHPSGEFGAAYRFVGSEKSRVSSCGPGDEMLANRSLTRSSHCLMSLCARDPIHGGNKSRINRPIQ